MPEWRKYRLENILSIVKNSVKPCNIDECNYIGLEHIAGKSFLLNDIGSSQDVESNKYSFKPNDILYGKLRPYFQKVYKPSFKGICSTDIFVIRTKDEKVVSQDFLYQIVREKKFTEWAMEGHTGTRMPRADWQALRKKMVLIPDDLNEQHRIASILSALDDKIELNLEMNKTLEEMAMAIYKEWFVDFGPFRDGEFVDSELGPIPKGWEVTLLKDVCIKITKGTTPTTLKRKFTDSGINFLKVESLTNDGYFNKNKFAYIDEETNEILKRSKIINNDILYSIAGTVGRTGIATENILPANTNQALAIIRPDNQKINPYHLYYIIKSPKTNEQLFPNVVQAVQANLSLSMLSELKFILSTTDIALDFSEKISFLKKMIDVKNSENEILSNIRDYLLPKLVSGEVRVKVAEEKLKEVL